MTTISVLGDTNLSLNEPVHATSRTATASGFSVDLTGGVTGSLQVEGENLSYDDGVPNGGTVTGLQVDLTNGLSVDASNFSVPVSTAAQWINDTDVDGALDYLFQGDDSVTFDADVPSDDRFSFLGGNDTVSAGAGNDLIYGNAGSDHLFGNTGRDTLYGGQGVDQVYGGQGDDSVFGNLGNDVVYGNLGNDTLHGGQGNDGVFGGKGNDVLFGDLGNDTMVGGQGADTYVFGQDSGTDLVQGFNQAKGDRLDLQGQTYTVGSMANGSALLTLSGGGTVELAGVAQNQVNGSFFIPTQV